MVGEHDSARANANAARFRSDGADDDRCRRAGDSGKIMMLRQPETIIAPFLGVLRKIDSITKSQRRITALDDGGQIEQGKPRHGKE
jgi:hypothetical protein